jgi:hypothetical protein
MLLFKPFSSKIIINNVSFYLFCYNFFYFFLNFNRLIFDKLTKLDRTGFHGFPAGFVNHGDLDAMKNSSSNPYENSSVLDIGMGRMFALGEK